ncbi:AzlC family ABC transporter permease [Peptoniphilus harei]|uniref:AzlC family ABC transporter permease n=1 Tax=Peptoniphilus harei TaxID=54005 RepID=UPI0028FE7E7A|nr:AzlC family ABC transporter permease [Peptoniphilus harei]MDU1643257.1 AzlC family ABC transporter permease [Peptoniphilus harei]
MIKNLKKVFPITIPILISFLFIGLSFGIYTSSFGYEFWMLPLTSVVIFSGSIQFVVVEAMHSGMDVLSYVLVVVMMNIRHFFYALTCLGKFKDMSRKKKTYAYYALCDEAYSMIMGTEVPGDMKK